jgi:hypothetical protein
MITKSYMEGLKQRVELLKEAADKNLTYQPELLNISHHLRNLLDYLEGLDYFVEEEKKCSDWEKDFEIHFGGLEYVGGKLLPPRIKAEALKGFICKHFVEEEKLDLRPVKRTKAGKLDKRVYRIIKTDGIVTTYNDGGGAPGWCDKPNGSCIGGTCTNCNKKKMRCEICKNPLYERQDGSLTCVEMHH